MVLQMKSHIKTTLTRSVLDGHLTGDLVWQRLCLLQVTQAPGSDLTAGPCIEHKTILSQQLHSSLMKLP